MSTEHEAVTGPLERGVGRLEPRRVTADEHAVLMAALAKSQRVVSHGRLVQCTCGAMHLAGATAWTCEKHGKIVAD